MAKKYGVPRAKVKELQESASKFALMVAAFCECLGWSDLDILISKFQVRHVKFNGILQSGLGSQM